MQLNREFKEENSIRSYDDHSITVNTLHITQSMIITAENIIPWVVKSLTDVNKFNLKEFIDYKPQVAIIGHNSNCKQLSMEYFAYLAEHRIGLECMNIGSACRTFNLLLNEKRKVMLGVIL